MNDRQLEERVAAELRQMTGPFVVTFADPVMALQLAGLMQLALRHPGVSPALRWTADRFLAEVRAYFAECPALLAVLRAGDDPTQDRPS